MTSSVAAGELIAEVVAEAAGIRIRLYLVDGFYRLRLGSGVGWAPDRWTDRTRAMRKLLAVQSYGPAELAMCRRICRVNP